MQALFNSFLYSEVRKGHGVVDALLTLLKIARFVDFSDDAATNLS